MSRMRVKFVLILLPSAISLVFSAEYNTNGTNSLGTQLEDESGKLLSRRKRYLVFPDGSSFQFVFCTQNHGYLRLGDIVWFANTAALAWELPTDPKLFYFFKDHKNDFHSQRRVDSPKHIYYLDEKGKVIAKVPYKRKLLVNPAFAKRSIEDDDVKIDKHKIKKLHETTKQKNLLRDLEKLTIDFHRSGREGFYMKLEKFLEALGWNGKQCVLRLLCETGNTKTTQQGNFIEEILRATFTLPQGCEFKSEANKLYDTAHAAGGNCADLYPECADLD